MFRKNLSRKNLIIRSILAVLVLAVLVLCWIYQDSIFPGTAYADSEYHSDVLVDGYSLVLDDLKQDSSFDPDDYPEDNTDYSMSLIQIAESNCDELFLYVYQPYTGSEYDLTATSVSISLTLSDSPDLKYKMYSLTLLNYDGVFYKYLVDDLEYTDSFSYDTSLGSVYYHNYCISGLYRTFYRAIDGDYLLDNTSDGYSQLVSQEWQVRTVSGFKTYWCSELRVLEITPYVSWVRYFSEWNSTLNEYTWLDAYFVAFKCDFDIDFLYEADCTYYTVKYEMENTHNDRNINIAYGDHAAVYNDDEFSYETVDDTYLYIPRTFSYDSVNTVTQNGLNFKKKSYEFSEILTVDDFFDSIDSYSDTAKSVEYGDDDLVAFVRDCDYVINIEQLYGDYCATKTLFAGTAYWGEYAQVKDLNILRLKYDWQGSVYNIGVVTNTVSPNDDVKDGSFAVVDNSDDTSCWDAIKVWFWIILGILVFILLLPVLPYIVKALIWIVCAPFKFIRWCYRKNKERKRKKQEKLDQKKADQEQKNKDQNIQVKDSLSSSVKLDSSIRFDVPDVSVDSGKSGKNKKKKNE